MIDAAEINIRAATVLACQTAEETAEKLKARASAQRYDSMMNSISHFMDEFYANLPPKEELEAMVKEIFARKAAEK